jgi:C4-dicarboxylate-specific signal transduction histidine kinase
VKPIKDWRLYNQLLLSGILPILFSVIIIGSSFFGGLFELKNDAIAAQNIIQDIRTHLFFYTSELREYLITDALNEPDETIFKDLAGLKKELNLAMNVYAEIAREREAASEENLKRIKLIYTDLNRISQEIEHHEVDMHRQNHEIESLESNIETIFHEITALAEKEIKIEMALLSILVVSASIISLLAAYIFFRKTSKRFTNQILVLKNASTDFGEGKLSSRAQIDSSNEMGMLSQTFNKMADELQQSVKLLEIEVERRKASEDKLIQSHLELESRVKQRSEELKTTYQQLAHAGRLTALGEMATGIAHEIRQPLTIISLATRTLTNFTNNKNYDPERVRSAAEKINEQVKRADRIIDHMRAFARTDRSDFQHINLATPVIVAASFFKEQCKLHDIRFDIDIDKTIPQILADPQKIEQLVVNLISNARYAIESKKLSHADSLMQIRIKVVQAQNNGVCIAVSDNGTGMDEMEKEKCMEPFFTTKPVGQGTGLGLSIVYNIVRELNGTIEIESEKDKGSTFRITLPTKEKENG